MKDRKNWLNYLRSKIGMNSGDANELEGVEADVKSRWQYGQKAYVGRRGSFRLEDEEEEEETEETEEEDLEEAKKWKWVIRRDKKTGRPKKEKKWYSDREEEGFRIENDGQGNVKEVKYTALEKRERELRRRKAKGKFRQNKQSNIRKQKQSMKIRDNFNLKDVNE